MNVIALRLVLVGTKTGFVVMCKILMVVVMFFECTYVYSSFLGRDSLPLVLIHDFIDQKCQKNNLNWINKSM